ncbi:MAG: F0F1 ATP synthase subunit A [Verrucomicrobiales bacterium]
MPSPMIGAVSLTAEPVFGPLTNSIVMALIVCGVITFFVRRAMKDRKLVPDQRQNVVEFVAEFLYNQVEGIVGKKLAPRAFPLLGTLFIFILVSNYFGLLPGVGTIGWNYEHVEHGGEHAVAAEVAAAPHGEPAASDGGHGDAHAVGHLVPWFRPASADLNFTLALALVFMVLWGWLTVKEVGVWGFIVHTFGPKGGLKGVMKYALIPIFVFVGMIEIISIAFRPVSLSLRLFGNIFAGETLLHAMSSLLGELGFGAVPQFIGKVLLPLPFYFLELLVGVLQATVFTLLCAVYIQLSTAHDEEHGDHGHEDDASDPAHAH